MASVDRISGLPAEILDHILGFLPIEDAAKTAVLSTLWRDMWFGLTQIKFNAHFFRYIDMRYHYVVRWGVSVIVNRILLQRSGGIRKFVFNYINSGIYTLQGQQPGDIDRWLHLVTQKGVEEIDFCLFRNANYKVPNCIFSCSTLKRLHLYHVRVEHVDFPCKLPNVTSLSFVHVHFGPRNLSGCAVDTPLLENLLFSHCQNIFYFNITTPKLCILDMDSGSLQYFVEELTRMGLPSQQVALKVEYLKISDFFFHDDVITSAFVQLLQACPSLCELDLQFWFEGERKPACVDGMLKLPEKLWNLTRTHKMPLRVLKLSSCRGNESEILLIKGITDCFPTLKKVVIAPYCLFRRDVLEIMRKNSRFLFPPTKTDIVFV